MQIECSNDMASGTKKKLCWLLVIGCVLLGGGIATYMGAPLLRERWLANEAKAEALSSSKNKIGTPASAKLIISLRRRISA